MGSFLTIAEVVLGWVIVSCRGRMLSHTIIKLFCAAILMGIFILANRHSDDVEFTKEDVWGPSRALALFVLFIVTGTALFSVYVSLHYQLEDSSNPVLLMMAVSVYLMTAITCYFFRKKLFPYFIKAPNLGWLGIFSYPVPVVMFAYAAFLFCNASLDTQEPHVLHYSVVAAEKKGLRVQMSPVSQSVIGVPMDIYKSAHKGDDLAVTVSPGFFRQPWIKGYALTKK